MKKWWGINLEVLLLELNSFFKRKKESKKNKL
jgi:hypothetical protein